LVYCNAAYHNQTKLQSDVTAKPLVVVMPQGHAQAQRA